MTSLGEHVEEYLALRRSLGFTLDREGRSLGKFAAHLQALGAERLTAELAIAWAKEPATAGPAHWAKRLGIVRRFAAYLKTIDAATEVPPAGVFPARRQRRTPYLYSDRDVARVLEGARALRPQLRAATHEALFGLLTVSGMRIGEALALERGDVDLDRGVITIRHAKFDRERLVPLHESTTAALRRYAIERDRLSPGLRPTVFFCSSRGTALSRSAVDKVFRDITIAIGLCNATVRPRVHDLRHSFAVRTIVEWQRSSVCIDQRIGVLSTYLGHVAPSDTYWYLSASPELMELSSQRLEARFGVSR